MGPTVGPNRVATRKPTRGPTKRATGGGFMNIKKNRFTIQMETRRVCISNEIFDEISKKIGRKLYWNIMQTQISYTRLYANVQLNIESQLKEDL
jgi:hypothetical protein